MKNSPERLKAIEKKTKKSLVLKKIIQLDEPIGVICLQMKDFLLKNKEHRVLITFKIMEDASKFKYAFRQTLIDYGCKFTTIGGSFKVNDNTVYIDRCSRKQDAYPYRGGVNDVVVCLGYAEHDEDDSAIVDYLQGTERCTA